jgi:hypothetical protein
MGSSCSRKCCRRNRRRREHAKPTQGVTTVVQGSTEEHPSNVRRRHSMVKVIVVQDLPDSGIRGSPVEDDADYDMDGMRTPQSTMHDDRFEGISPTKGANAELTASNLARVGSMRKGAQPVVKFDVCSVDQGSWEEMSVISSGDGDDGLQALDTQQSFQAQAIGGSSAYSAAEFHEGGNPPFDSPGRGGPGAAGGGEGPEAQEVDTKHLDFVMSRIFSATYHTPAMCLLNINVREESTLLSSKKLSNTVIVSEKFSTLVFKQKKTSANEILLWLLARNESAYTAATETRAEVLSPLLSQDDMIFFADQRRILRRLLMKPLPKSKGQVDANDVDSDFDDSDTEYNPDEDINNRTLEEGFCQVLLPPHGVGRGGKHADPAACPAVATLYVSTIAAQTLPPDLRTTYVRETNTPLLSVVSVVGIRPLNSPSVEYVRNHLAQFPQSRAVLTDECSGSVFIPNVGPCFVRGSHFTGNVFVKTMTDPEPDPRIQPYFEGKNRKFEIQIQGRFTPPPGFDLRHGTICFCVYLEDKLGGPGGKPLSFFQGTMIKGIVNAFKLIARGGLQVMRGDENAEAFPFMAIPLLTFLDRMSLRADDKATSPLNEPVEMKHGEEYKVPKASPPLALGVAMLPDTPELAHMKKLADKEHKKKHKHKHHHEEEPTKTPFETRTTSYTMSFHSQYVDFECWMVRKLPGFSNVDLHTYWGNQHVTVGVGFVPEGVPLTEIRTKGTFLLKLKVLHDSNVAAHAAAAAADGGHN